MNPADSKAKLITIRDQMKKLVLDAASVMTAHDEALQELMGDYADELPMYAQEAVYEWREDVDLDALDEAITEAFKAVDDVTKKAERYLARVERLRGN